LRGRGGILAGVFQHQEGLAAAHVVEVGVAADIHEKLFQHRHGDATNHLKGRTAYQGLYDQPGLGDIDIVIEDLFVRAVEDTAAFVLEAVEKDFRELPLGFYVCESVVGEVVLQRGEDGAFINAEGGVGIPLLQRGRGIRLPCYLFLESMLIVTGPSFTRPTFMSAPKTPVPTGLPMAADMRSQKSS